MAGWPLIGRFVQIGVAVIRLPQWRAEHVAMVQRSQAFEARILEFGHRQQMFEAQQLPTLLQTVSEINHRQLATDVAKDNLVRSVPIALRRLFRDAADLRAQFETGKAQQDAEMRAFSDEVGARLVNLTRGLAYLQAQFESGMARRAAEMRALNDEERVQLDSLNSSVSYLLGRVEFVRRELMFEMRYGARKPSEKGDSLETETKILSPEKLRAARASGLRLNLGCGHAPLDGYLNVDRRALPAVDIVAEVDRLPFQDGDLDEISSAHLVEHFPQEQLRRELLPYWLRLLKPGGLFRAIVPDSEGMINAFKTGEYPFERLREVTFGGQDYDGDFHYNMLTPVSFSTLLSETGFADVEIVAANRENGGCKEFEIIARRR